MTLVTLSVSVDILPNIHLSLAVSVTGWKDLRRLLLAISISVAFSRLPDLAVFAEEKEPFIFPIIFPPDIAIRRIK